MWDLQLQGFSFLSDLSHRQLRAQYRQVMSQVPEGIQKFKELLEILVKYKANDTEAKFQLCNNLFCIIDAESEEEIELREMLMEQIKDEPATVEYVHNFLTNREEK